MCEAFFSTLCTTGMGCLLGAVTTAMAGDPTGTLAQTLGAFFACAGVGAILGALTSACNALGNFLCSLMDCDLATPSIECLIADMVATGIGGGLGCALPVEGSGALVAGLLGLDVSLLAGLGC